MRKNIRAEKLKNNIGLEKPSFIIKYSNQKFIRTNELYCARLTLLLHTLCPAGGL
jgi:hypothetical protein